MNDQQLLRYSRQILLPQIDVNGQQRLRDSCILLIGAGGLGSPVAMYLAAAGIGQLTIVDDDKVDLSNLQRQILHRSSDIGRPKVESAKDTLNNLNPEVQVKTLPRRLNSDELNEQVQASDLVVDCSDNFATRFAINRACVTQRVPLVSGAAIRMEGQLSVFNPNVAESPCYRCLYKEGDEPEQTCAETGVLSPVVGIIGSLQALEALKVVLGLGKTLCGRLLIFDGQELEWRSIKLNRDPACPVCGT